MGKKRTRSDSGQGRQDKVHRRTVADYVQPCKGGPKEISNTLKPEKPKSQPASPSKPNDPKR